jgi:hypothetical protein
METKADTGVAEVAMAAAMKDTADTRGHMAEIMDTVDINSSS